MGTHPKAPSTITGNSQTLGTWLNENPSAIGEGTKSRFGSTKELPYLFKVLSVNMALSIQAHPNKVI